MQDPCSTRQRGTLPPNHTEVQLKPRAVEARSARHRNPRFSHRRHTDATAPAQQRERSSRKHPEVVVATLSLAVTAIGRQHRCRRRHRRRTTTGPRSLDTYSHVRRPIVVHRHDRFRRGSGRSSRRRKFGRCRRTLVRFGLTTHRRRGARAHGWTDEGIGKGSKPPASAARLRRLKPFALVDTSPRRATPASPFPGRAGPGSPAAAQVGALRRAPCTFRAVHRAPCAPSCMHAGFPLRRALFPALPGITADIAPVYAGRPRALSALCRRPA